MWGIAAFAKVTPFLNPLLGQGTPARKYLVGSLFLIAMLVTRMLVAQRREAKEELRAIAWLLRDARKPLTEPQPQPYGDLSELNTARTILDTVGKDLLVNVAGDALHLIGTSGSVCEQNGDYATSLVASDWCRFLDEASRGRSVTVDNGAALASSEWHCRQSCREVSARSMETGQPADLPCKGGINLYAAPIKVDGETVGSISIGYGDPPKDDGRLIEVAERYGVPVEKLRELSEHMPSRPRFIVEVAKARLRSAAVLLSEIIKRKRTEEALADLTKHLEERITERTEKLVQSQEQLRALATELNIAEQYERKRLAAELHDHLQHSMTVRVTVPDTNEFTLPEDEAVLLFQSVRELLINSSKYAGTGEATVSLEQCGGQLRIQVRDEGVGFDPTAAAAPIAGASAGGVSSKFGLFSIRERMMALGGSFDMQAAPGKGATATLTLPLR
jgi:two-component sensor histidine kinase